MFNTIKNYIYFLFGFTCIYAGIPPLQLYNLTDRIHSELIDDKVWLDKIESKERGEHFHGYILIEEDINLIYKVISELENYNLFMPHVSKVQKISNGTHPNYRYFLQLPMGIDYQYQISISKYQSSDSCWLSWQLEKWDENNIVDTWGQWFISPYKNTNKILVQYQVYTDLGEIPFGFRWLVSFLTEHSLPKILINTKEYVEAIN